MIVLNVITAVSRPQNLPRVQESLERALAPTVHIALEWHKKWDLACEHVGGHRRKNEMLDEIDDGWVWILDDDTVAHPEVLMQFEETLAFRPDADAVVFSQDRGQGVVLHAAPENARLNCIDTGQAFLRRDLIGDDRHPEVYDGDGRLFETVLARARKPVYVDKVLSIYNALREG